MMNSLMSAAHHQGGIEEPKETWVACGTGPRNGIRTFNSEQHRTGTCMALFRPDCHEIDDSGSTTVDGSMCWKLSH